MLFLNKSKVIKLKELLLQLAAYNVWANHRITDLINGLDIQLQNTNIESSFGNLRGTIQHMANAESIWWQRMKLVELPYAFDDQDMSLELMNKKLLEFSNQWKEWIEKSASNALEHEFLYHNTKKEQFKQPVYQMLLHLFNHQTYHRGQLVIMLKQLGVEKIPPTDFIVWSRSAKH